MTRNTTRNAILAIAAAIAVTASAPAQAGGHGFKVKFKSHKSFCQVVHVKKKVGFDRWGKPVFAFKKVRRCH